MEKIWSESRELISSRSSLMRVLFPTCLLKQAIQPSFTAATMSPVTHPSLSSCFRPQFPLFIFLSPYYFSPPYAPSSTPDFYKTKLFRFFNCLFFDWRVWFTGQQLHTSYGFYCVSSERECYLLCYRTGHKNAPPTDAQQQDVFFFFASFSTHL